MTGMILVLLVALILAGRSKAGKARSLIVDSPFSLALTAQQLTGDECAPVTCDKSGPIVGIDLGTTYSAVATVWNDQIKVIGTSAGESLLPSVVTFLPDGKVEVGSRAKRGRVTNPENTVYAPKRLMGQMFHSRAIQRELDRFQFKLVNDNERAWIKVPNRDALLTPEEVSAVILSDLRRQAEKFFGVPVTRAVVTVPANFDSSQRLATRVAGQIAGLCIEHLLSEPTAAAIAYQAFWGDSNQEFVVFDLGGGTLDVTLMTVDTNGRFHVISTDGDTHLGGEDFDYEIVKAAEKNFRMETGQELTNELRGDLWVQAERAKNTLSTEPKASLLLEKAYKGRDFEFDVGRGKFESLCKGLLDRVVDPIKAVLKDADLIPSDIKDVVMIGGASRIPAVIARVRTFFGRNILRLNQDLDIAVARGAAYRAVHFKDDEAGIDDLIGREVVPSSLGVKVVSRGTGEQYKVLRVINRNDALPATGKRFVTTVRDNQSSVKVEVFKGESTVPIPDNLLGSFDLEGVEPGLARVPNISVTLRLDSDGVLHTVAEDLKSRSHAELVIRTSRVSLSQDELSERRLNFVRDAAADQYWTCVESKVAQFEGDAYSEYPICNGVETVVRRAVEGWFVSNVPLSSVVDPLGVCDVKKTEFDCYAVDDEKIRRDVSQTLAEACDPEL